MSVSGASFTSVRSKSLGFNAEYDALPDLSQKKGISHHDPLVYNYDAYGPTYGAGHGDAHNTLGAGSVAAAIAVTQAIVTGGGAPNVTPDMCSIWFYIDR